MDKKTKDEILDTVKEIRKTIEDSQNLEKSAKTVPLSIPRTRVKNGDFEYPPQVEAAAVAN